MPNFHLDLVMSRIAIIGAGITGVTTAYALAGRHTERRTEPMRRWFENGLARLLAATYVAAMARAMDALPHDELT